MTNEDIRKLLGGYATNTLTESERKALFDAALDDQELFDALQREQPLKELLADPVSRAQVRQALDQPSGAKAWWSRWWAWGSVATAVAAVIVIVAVIPSNQPQVAMPPLVGSRDAAAPAIVSREVQSSANQRKEQGEQKKPGASDRLAARRSAATYALRAPANTGSGAVKGDAVAQATPPPPAAATPPPAPATPPSATAETVQVTPVTPSPIVVQQQAQQGHSEQAPSARAQSAGAASQVQVQNQITGSVAGFRSGLDLAVPAELSKQITTAVNSSASNYQNGPLLRYSLARPATKASSDAELKAGETVLLDVLPGVGGYLALYELDATGDWTRLYPVTAQAIPVVANSSYRIPESPIALRPNAARLRLVLVPTATTKPGAIGGALFERQGVRAKKAEPAKVAVEPSGPLVVDIPITQKRE